MRFRLSTILMLTALVCVSVGWLVSERRHAIRRNNDLLFLHELARFRANNAAYRSADAFYGTPDYQITKDRMLVNSIKLTYRLLSGSDQSGAIPSEEYRLAFQNEARASCALLGIESASDFREFERAWIAAHPGMPTGPPVLDPDTHELTPGFADFLEELFATNN